MKLYAVRYRDDCDIEMEIIKTSVEDARKERARLRRERGENAVVGVFRFDVPTRRRQLAEFLTAVGESGVATGAGIDRTEVY